jgi:hypothetical protein
MPNHWHLALGPREDGELSAFLRWLTHTHTMRWHAHHHTAGTGHLYHGPRIGGGRACGAGLARTRRNGPF